MKQRFFACFFTYLLLIHTLPARSQQLLHGRVVAMEDGKPLAGAAVRAGNAGTSADKEGNFKLKVTGPNVRLTVSFLGFRSLDTLLALPQAEPLILRLKAEPGALQEVVVNTGYQQLPKERATGSFVIVDNELLNRRVGSNLINRLEDVAPGLLVRPESNNALTIRGRSTIEANASPLIVLDNLPYEGSLESVNPNDIESITVLKDAAASSIWGARAGNGVIVLTSKRGRLKQKSHVSLNSNFSIAEKPDAFYKPQMSSADFIEIEKTLFARNFYRSNETSAAKIPLSPVVELLIAARDGKITAQEANSQIEALKNNDVRNDFSKYLYRGSSLQQYALNISGGGESQTYYISGGFDKNLSSLRGNDNQRISLNASNTYHLLNDKLKLNAGIYFIKSKVQTNSPGTNLSLGSAGSLYPYARLADQNGAPLSLAKDVRLLYTNTARGTYPSLLDWAYRPLEELELADNRRNNTDTRLNTSLKYRVFKGMDAELTYVYGNYAAGSRNLQQKESYYVRNQVNRISQPNADYSLTRPMPAADILDTRNSVIQSNRLRGQLSYGNSFGDKHSLNAIAGWEINKEALKGDIRRLYGYDDEHATGSPVDYVGTYASFVNPSTRYTIPFMDDTEETSERFVSVFANAAYSFKHRYTLSASARKDESNIFGVKTNQKGVPLWSAGLSWIASEEAFYRASLLPYLRFRFTYGLSGNVDKSMSAYTTALYYSSAQTTFLPYAIIANGPNPDLRWEKIKTGNLAVDFETKNQRISGTAEYYLKIGKDLLGSTVVAPQTGMGSVRGNFAASRVTGFDISLSSRNTIGAFKWNSTLLMSQVKEKVTDYDVSATAALYASGSLATPLEGRPLFGLYSFRWYGLDGQTGDPLGYVNGELSKNYSQIVNTTKPEDLVFHGSLTPTWFGSLRNSFSYRNFSVSALISYRLGYWFRRNTVFYGANNGLSSGSPDYALRWQKPGDEAFTQVPSIPATSNTNRDYLYRYSELTAEKGDHIRLQDINISYDLLRSNIPRLPVSRLQVYVYLNNLGLLWKANDAGLDPEYLNMKPQRSFALGLKADL